MGPTEIQKVPRKTFIQRSGKMNKIPKSVKRSLLGNCFWREGKKPEWAVRKGG